MTIPYEATDKNCIECGHPVEDYTGHSSASEVTLCTDCPDELETEKWQYRADIVHRIPRKEKDMTDEDLIYDITRTELRDTVSIDFRLDLPVAPHEDLKSSASVEDGTVERFELRLGLLSKERYDPEGIEEVMYDILGEMDLPDHQDGYLPDDTDREPADEIDAKISYDPDWGAIGFYQVHLKCNSFFPLAMDEDEFEVFVRQFTGEFIERVEWDDPADTDERYEHD